MYIYILYIYIYIYIYILYNIYIYIYYSIYCFKDMYFLWFIIFINYDVHFLLTCYYIHIYYIYIIYIYIHIYYYIYYNIYIPIYIIYICVCVCVCECVCVCVCYHPLLTYCFIKSFNHSCFYSFIYFIHLCYLHIQKMHNTDILYFHRDLLYHCVSCWP